ncbi:Glucokinase regulatory protein [Heterocephalus glaber]|uniref:Glucokinase regulatory protein n=1 Tax=Heterocephalus glaber TaxID=10181 RepID=G5BA52_HETGA|nr:Glucokinase regulatory protein [Heterocephalus glaber]
MPITEKSNPLTRDLDKADAGKIVQLLGQCDAEIFQEEGQAMPAYQLTQAHPLDTHLHLSLCPPSPFLLVWKLRALSPPTPIYTLLSWLLIPACSLQRLYSESVLTTMLQVAGKVQEVLKEPDGGLVVLSGGGTSSRMAFLMSVSFNQLMTGLGQKPLYTYLIAGGDRSVVASREGKEDSALHGIEELKKVAAGKKRVIVIGISAGLSALGFPEERALCPEGKRNEPPSLRGANRGWQVEVQAKRTRGSQDGWGPGDQDRMVQEEVQGVVLREASAPRLIISVAQISLCQLEAESL